MQKQFIINYQHYYKWSDLPEKAKALAKAALDISTTAHAPYSNFFVGAACLLDNGVIMTHANFENAAFSMCLCAERSLIAAVQSKFPSSKIEMMFVTAQSPKSRVEDVVTPCGACRHVMVEVETIQNKAIELYCSCETEETLYFNASSDIIPFALKKL